MKKGLKLFEHFSQVHMEVCITDKDRERFERMYLSATSENPAGKDGYYERMLHDKNQAWGIEYRIYFKVSDDWVIDSLKKLGFYVEQPKHMIAIELDKHHPDHGYKLRIANTDFFWWLIDYGYRLGENNSIPFDLYELREYLRNKKEKPLFDINTIEAENPIFEAMLLSA